MNKSIMFIQSCVRRDINTDDLGYITKDFINNMDDNTAFMKSIEERIKSKFFDQNNTISSIFDLHKSN